ncbi:hypothetical protein ACFX13_009912 [Malus domestica]|uniref:Uncharacterized protein n=1 Tax=Malus domestica TaxID=3750 RepID=A0A498IGS3_MALDO|nr:hypothetical protein DVH24_006159 [Malus domestica]
MEGGGSKGAARLERRGKAAPGGRVSDVLLYLVRLSDICGVDLGKAALRKVELNAIKYHFHVKCNGQIY